LRGLSLPIAGGQKISGSGSGREEKKRKHIHDVTSVQPGPIKHAEATKGNSTNLNTGSAAIKVEPRTGVQTHMSWRHQPSLARSSIPPTLHTTKGHAASFNGRVVPRVSESSLAGNELGSTLLYGDPRREMIYQNNIPIKSRSAAAPNFENPFSVNRRFNAHWHNIQEHQSMATVPGSPLSTNGNILAASMQKPPNHHESEDHFDEIVYGGTGSRLGHQTAATDQGSPIYGSLSSEYRLSLSRFTGMTSIGKTPRMKYLINYYSEVISPVIVAFDSPSNPYRTHILQLAAGNETLQHAISALSASNLRQRRETGALSTGKTGPARRSSMAHLSLTDATWLPAETQLTVQEQVREESFHKCFSIKSLNAQLADPLVRKDDSILATLLILCLFHICDSGVAKFKTQFAGVKKLLSLRGEDAGCESRRTKWFTRMFAWFDAMTATVNNRDGELGQVHLDMSALSDEEWALENLAGCDGQLFKTTAKLGRLNLLSQGQAVESKSPMVVGPFPMIQPYSNFDGNGWSQVLNDDDIWTSKSLGLVSDTETQFWTEWRQIRNDLQRWSLDTSLFDASSSEASLLLPEQRDDLANISESFRYSALLYTERLASPGASSSDANIQNWVQRSLKFIKLVKSDVFLLWPLFITGSECASEEDRSVIRERCLDIQKDSGFFNNQSCLELLEKVWKANPPLSTGHGTSVSQRNHGFKFTNIIREEKNDGEYIVV
jgi:hypothetical protein